MLRNKMIPKSQQTFNPISWQLEVCKDHIVVCPLYKYVLLYAIQIGNTKTPKAELITI